MIDLDKFEVNSILPYMKSQRMFDSLMYAVIYLEENCKKLKLDYIFLFGSVARGEADCFSDIDILVLTSADTEREVRMALYEYDDIADPSLMEVQFTVRKTSRFVDEESDVCGFNKIILKDLILLRRY